MLKKWSSSSSRDDRRCDVHQRGVVERLEVHREAGAHRLARLRMPEDDPAAAREAVDRALLAARELHHEQLRAAVVGQERQQLLELHRGRDPGAVRAAAAGAGRRPPTGSGSPASRTTRAASPRPPRPGSRARARPPRPPPAADPSPGRARARRSRRAARTSPPCRSSGAPPRARRRARRTESARARRRAREGRTTTAAAPRRRLRARPARATASANPGSSPAGTTWNASHRWRPTASSAMSVPTTRTRALAVLAQRAHERGGARRAGRRDEDREVLHVRSIRSAASRSRSRSRSASSIACIVSRIVSPG